MNKLFLLFIAAYLTFGFNYYSDPDYPIIKKTIAIGEAEKVRSKIDFSAGVLIVNPISSENLMEGKFKFYKRNKPVVYYEEKGDIGYLEISDKFDFDLDDNETKWELDINNKVSNDVYVDIGAGETKINLEGCSLERFKFEIGAGEADINLRNTSVPEVDFSAGAGEFKIDLSGEWNNDLRAEISGGVGEITIILPDDIGIELEMSGLLGERNAPGFHKDGSMYTNDLLGQTTHTLYLDVTGGIGSISVRTVH